MATEIEALQLGIKVNSESANRKLDAFVKKISEIKSVLTGIDEDKMAALNMAMGSGVGASKPVEEIKKAADEGNAAMKTLKSSTTEVSDAAKSTGKSGAEEMEKITQTVQSTSTKMVSLKDGFKNLLSPLKKFGKLFGDIMRIAKHRMIRSVIKQITQGFSEGMKNLYEYSKSINGTFAEARDKVTTATAYLKNSIGAMMGGLYEMAAPVIDKIVDGVVEGLNYVNRMIAAISGKSTWTKAVKNLKEYNDEAKRTILGIDEINKLNGDESGNGLYDFKEMKLATDEASSLADMFDDIKIAAIGIGTAILGWKVASAFSDTIKSLSSLGKGQMIIGIGLAILGITMGYSVGKEIARGDFSPETILKAITSVIGSAIGFGAMATALGVSATAGAMVGIGITLIGTIIGLIVESQKGLYKKSDLAIFIENMNADIDARIERINTRWDEFKQHFGDLDNISVDFEIAKSMLDDIYELDSIINKTPEQIGELTSKIELFNALDIGNVAIGWDEISQKITTSREEVEKLIASELKELQIKAYQDLIVEAYRKRYDAQQDLYEALENEEQTANQLNSAYAERNELEKKFNDLAWYERWGWYVDENASTINSHLVMIDAQIEELEKTQEKAKQTSQLARDEVNDYNIKIEQLTNSYVDLNSQIKNSTESTKKMAEATEKLKSNLSYEQLSKLGQSIRHPTKKYATGGFPSQGSMFIANESGAEMVGTIGNRTAVANTGDITTAISDAVYQAFSSAGGNGGNITIQMMDESGNVRSEKYISAAQKRNLRDGKITLPVGV